MCLGISLSYFFTSTTVISIGIIRPNCSDGTLPPQWGHTTTATRRTCEWMGGQVSRVRIKLIKLQFIRSLLGWLLLAVVLRVLLLVLTLDDHGWILGRLITWGEAIALVVVTGEVVQVEHVEHRPPGEFILVHVFGEHGLHERHLLI